MAKQLNVNLAFTADSRAAKAQIQDLQDSLTRLVNSVSSSTANFGLTKDLTSAISKANELKIILEKATTSSGGLDLGTFNSELQKSGLKLSDYAASLNSLGAEGQQAFAKIATSITQAGVPLKRTNAMLDEFTTTLKNTARWQISSSILHGFMGTLQSAYGYAEDLNESLNNIRIVTGYSTDQMATFADEANKAAKALSTTTTEYTNASLIYYQQGLSDDEVLKRTDITVKMANVARQSAETVSDQMTAVWNNFYDGSKSLEYYADVMTALGAKTASSTDEIAGGLEKFAAIGTTIGLSYEYAASALATITSNTRQSEEVVGTALKTIFARIQGLNLGETLDDGTTLNKYSDALNKVGISIFDQAGELKTMDALLDEMGSKWDTLNSAQQTALAQTVAGVRQYTQLIALMENWDNGDNDSFQANLMTANTSTGALQEQADIYAESWEAARDRVTAAAEDIYQSLLDDDFFITVLNGFEKLLGAVDNLIDGLGGMPGVLLTLGTIITNVFSDDISQGLSNMLYNLTYNTQTARQEIEILRKDAVDAMRSLGDDSISGSAAIDVFNQQAKLQDELLLKQKELENAGTTLTEQEQRKAQLMMDTAARLGEQVTKTAQLREAQESVTDELIEQLRYEGNTKNVNLDARIKRIKDLQTTYATLAPIASKAAEAMKKINNTQDDEKKKASVKELAESLQAFKQGADNIGFSFDMLSDDVQDFLNSLEKIDTITPDSLQAGLTALQDDLNALNSDARKAMDSLRAALKGDGVDDSKIRAIMNELSNSFLRTGKLTQDQILQFKNLGLIVDETGNIIKSFNGKTANFADGITALSNQIMAVASGINTLKNLGSIWADEDATTGEKILSTLTSLAVVIPTLTSAFNQQNLAKLSGLQIDGLTITTTIAKIAGVKAETIAHAENTAALWKEIGAQMVSNLKYAAAIVIIGAVIAVIAGLTKAYNADANAAKRAAEAAEDLAESHEKVQQDLNNLKSAFDAYDTAVEALNACTKGTDEWDDALKRVNETVLDLMNQYPALLKDAELFSRNADGMLEINEAKRNEILNEQEALAASSQAAALFGAAHASEAAVKSEGTNVSRAIGNGYGVGDIHYTADGYSYYEDYINVGQIVADNALKLANLTESEYRTTLAEMLKNAASDQAKSSANFDAQINNLVDQCIKYQSSIASLAENTMEAANQMRNAAQLIADQQLGNDYNAAEKTIAGNALLDRENELKDAWKKLLTSNKGEQGEASQTIVGDTSLQVGITQTSKTSNAIYQAALQGLQDAGFNWTAATGNAILGGDTNRRLVFTDENGKRTDELSAEWIAGQIASAQALKELGASAEEARNSISHLNTTVSSGEAEAISNLITNSKMNTMSKNDRIAMTASIDKDNDNGLSSSEILNYLRDSLDMNDEQLIQAFGVETIDEVTAKFVEAWNDNRDALENAGSWLTKTTSEMFKSLNLNDLDVNEKNIFADTLNTAFGNAGRNGAKLFTDAFQSLIDDEDKINFVNVLDDINWPDVEVQDVRQAFLDAGVAISLTDEKIQNMINAMAGTSEATLDSVSEQYAKIKEIIDGLEKGDTISGEDFKLLGEEYSQYFMRMADGTYQLIADADEFYKIINNNTLPAFKEVANSLREEAELLKKILNGNNLDNLTSSSATATSQPGRYSIDMSKANEQYDLLSVVGGVEDVVMQEWNLALQNGTFDKTMADEMAEAVDRWVNSIGGAKEAQSYLNNVLQETNSNLYDAESSIASFATSFAELQMLLSNGSITNLEIYNERLQALAVETLNASESLEELQQAMQVSQEVGANVNYEDYADNLIRLAEGYENCTKEIEAYKRALANNDSVEEAEDALEASLMLAEAAEEYGLESKELEVQSRQLAKAYNLDATAAAKLAVQNQRMNNGIITLAENWDKWSKALTEADDTTTDFADAVVNCTAAVAELVGASADLELPDDFFNTENLSLIEQAINGNIDAINRLGIAVAEEQIKMLEFNAAFASLAEESLSTAETIFDGILDEERFTQDFDIVYNDLVQLRNGSLDTATEMSNEWVAALNRMALATGMSVENMNDLLGSMGVQAKVTTTYVKQPMEVPTYTEHIVPQEPITVTQGEDEDGNPNEVTYTPIKKYSVPGKPIEVEGYAAVAQISTEDNPLTVDIDEKTINSSGPSSSGATYTGNRGFIASSTTEAVKSAKEKSAGKTPDPKDSFKVDSDEFKSLDEEAERYHEINNELEVLADNLDSISKEKNRAYGANKVKLIEQETEALKKQASAQARYIDEIKKYLDQDKTKLNKYGFMFNEDSDVINYDEVMDQQIQAYNAAYQAYIDAKNAAVDAFNASARDDAAEEIYDAAIEAADETWKIAQDTYETLQKDLELYEKTVDLLREAVQNQKDFENAIKDNNYEEIQTKLEVKLEINDAEMRMLDYYLNKLSDDFYSMAESAQLMIDKIPLMTNALESYSGFYDEVTTAFQAGEISEEDYIDGLKQSYDGILDNLEALNELDKEMMHYYEDTLAAGAEELAHYTDQMEHLTSVLDHYYNLIVMINGEYDYDSIGTILEGKATTIKNELEVAAANYEMLLEQQAMIQRNYDNAVDENARALHAEELKAINAQVDEAHELMLSKTEEWAEVQKAIMENVMAEAARAMEMAFTDNMGFDALNDSINRLSSNADEYLTKTNQIYETQKLINTAQQAIDKTTNNAAKTRLKSYQDEIALLQDKNKLTTLELDIAKAQYDVLLAEIALEEAQNAKATVRLQRDNEGNYGYVYTADQSQVAEAESNLMDSQNELYNIRLEAANEYGQKIMELNQQLADDLMALEEARAAGQFATEAEYQAAKETILREYYDLYETYSNLYTIATSEDARIEEEAWITAYEDIIDSADNWQQHINIYTRQCEDAYRDYRTTVSSESDVINGLLNGVQDEVQEVTDKSNDLKNKVKNEVIPAISDQYTKVSQVTAAYAAQRTGILQLIQTYEQLAQSILKAMQAQASLNALEQTPTGPTVPEESTNTNNAPENTNQETVDSATAQRAKAIALEAQEIVTKVHTGQIKQSALGWRPDARAQGYSEEAISVALKAFNDSKPGAGYDYYYDIALQLASRYNTGGYTGAWGPDGRLAVLDEKELVLNKQDTENFLTATGVLRSIADMIDLNSLHNQMSLLSSAGLAAAGSGTFEQSVSIEAHFPAVSDRNEIEEAFNNLINTASQYANRKI